ncbi:hypothetical protein LINPERPRIM_LOCUS32866 [Linum perenne]
MCSSTITLDATIRRSRLTWVVVPSSGLNVAGLLWVWTWHGKWGFGKWHVS